MTTLQQLIEGLAILGKYAPEIAAEHDIIYAGPDANEVTPGDKIQLESLGWHIDNNSDSWARFV